jgi:hypothetical protein
MKKKSLHIKAFQSLFSLSFSLHIRMGFKTEAKGVTLTVNTGALLELPKHQSSVVASSKVATLPPAVKASLPILFYCIASIVMTVTNKYVVSGDFNMVFFLLTVQVRMNNEMEKKGVNDD